MMLPLYTDPIQRRTVLWDLARRYPCAYTWMALPDTNTLVRYIIILSNSIILVKYVQKYIDIDLRS